MKKTLKILICITVVIAVISAAFTIYVSDYYRADYAAVSDFRIEENISITTADNKIIYAPQESDSLLIFYPGGKVASAPWTRTGSSFTWVSG